MNLAPNIDEPDIPKKSRKPLVIKIVLGILGALGVLVLFLPAILSTHWVRSFVVSQVNASIAPDKLTISDWSFSWWSNQSIKHVTYSSEKQGVFANIDTISLNNLKDLLPFGTLTADITITKPVIGITLPPATSTPPSSSVPLVGTTTPTAPTQARVTPAAKEPFTLPFDELNLRLIIVKGRVEFAQSHQAIVEDFAMKVSVDSLNKPVIFSLDLSLPGAEANSASFSGKTMPIAQVLQGDLTNMGEYQLAVTLNALAALNPILQEALPDSAPTLPNGQLNISLKAYNVAKDQFDFILKTHSPWLMIASDGSINPVTLQGKANLDTAVYLTPILHDFKLLIPESAHALQGGTIKLKASATGSEAESTVRLAMASDQLVVQIGEAKQTLNPEIVLVTNLDHRNWAKSKVTSFNLLFPGVSAKGNGTISDARFAIDVDLKKLFDTLRPLIPTIPESNGSVTVYANATDNEIDIEGNAEDFNLHHQVKLQAIIDPEKKTVENVHVNLSIADALNADFSLDSFSIDKQQLTNAQLKTSVDLKALLELIKCYQPDLQASPPLQLSGKAFMNVNAAGSITNKLTALFTSGIQNFSLITPSWRIEEQALFKLGGELDLLNNMSLLTLSNLDMVTPPATVSIPKLDLDLNAESPVSTITTAITGFIKPAYLVDTWRIYKEGETPPSIDGIVTFKLTTTKNPTAFIPDTSLYAKATTLTINAKTPHELTIPFTFDTSLAMPSANELLVSNVALTSPYARFFAQGKITELDKEMNAHIEGDLSVNFDTISELPQLESLKPYAKISGENTHPFSFSAPLGGGISTILSTAKAYATVSFDNIECPALDIGNGTFKVSIEEGIGCAKATVPFNNGTIGFDINAALTQEPMMIFMAKDTPFLNQVEISQEMFDFALGYINPLLQNALAPSGNISVICNDFSMLLDEDPLKNAKGSFTLSIKDGALMPSGGLKTILAICKKNGDRLTFVDRATTVTFEELMLTSDSLTISVDGVEILCTGQTNLRTQEINYTVAIPLGPLIGKGDSNAPPIILPITGTVTDPQIHTEKLVQAIGTVFAEKATDKIMDKLTEKLNEKLNEKQSRLDNPSETDTSRSQKKEERRQEIEEAADLIRGLFG